MIVITGAAGFIGSNLVSKFNTEGYIDLVLVDDFSKKIKNKNLDNKTFSEQIDRELFFDWVEKKKPKIDFVFHMGARTDTTEFDKAVFEKLNLGYSKKVWDICVRNDIPLVYASSAATYGDGGRGSPGFGLLK